MQNSPTRIAIIGCGGRAREHLPLMLREPAKNQVVVVSEPSGGAYQKLGSLFSAAGLPVPPNQPDLTRLLEEYTGKIDAAFIITPHLYHFEQAKRCLEAGLDVLLEKPMVIHAQEALDLIAARDRTKRLLVVAFNGSLSPQIRRAAAILRSGEVGEILNISAAIWENWEVNTRGFWLQDPVIAGGGFLFDTGAHLLNTVADLAGEDFADIAAWLDNRNRSVDILGAIIGRLKSGALVTMNACGDTVTSCASDIRVFCTKGIIHTGAWGEFLEIQREGDSGFTPVEFVNLPSAWDQFLGIRSGAMENSSPPEVGLRMAKTWDAIQDSARRNGSPVTLP